MLEIQAALARHQMVLSVFYKPVKNINLRVTSAGLSVSAPPDLPPEFLCQAIKKRLDWAIKSHQKLQSQPAPKDFLTLWGQRLDIDDWLSNQSSIPKKSSRKFAELSVGDRLKFIYKTELEQVLPKLQQKWQPVVGHYATSLKTRHMISRWGSCRVNHAKITLSTRLSAYPLPCSEYVLVHELCHLRYAHHQKTFWDFVKKVMPDYQIWHDMLRRPPDHQP